MSQAHEESAAKSMRIKAEWAAKKERIKAGKEVMTGRVHWWLRVSEDKTKYEVIEENANTIRLMFNLAKNGLGSNTIAKYLNENKFPTASHAKLWQTSTVMFHLRNISVIGVLQLDQDGSGRELSRSTRRSRRWNRSRSKRRPGGASCRSGHLAAGAGRQPVPGRQHLQPR
jgi:hypothetical protein